MTTGQLAGIAGYGRQQTSFTGPAANLNFNTGGSMASGRNHGVAVGPDGDIYVAATHAQVVGRIDAPSKWRQRDLPSALTAPPQALWWKVISTTNTPLQTISATTVDGHDAIRWQCPTVPANAWIYTVPTVLSGAILKATVTVKGTGKVYLNQHNGIKDNPTASVTLSDTPQTLTVTTPEAALGGITPEFQVRTPVAETGVDVTMWNISVEQSGVTGLAHPVAGVYNTPGYSGDHGSGEDAELNFPAGVAVGRDGSVYIADSYNNRIRRVDPSGRVETVAGNGTAGDGQGAALSAQLDHPMGIAVGPDSSIYIADTYNNRICRLDGQHSQLRTIAGTNTAGYSGDGGSATAAELDHPSAVAVDRAGNVYISDTYNNRVRMISTNGKINTVAGTGTAGYSGDGGPAIAAALATPQGIALDGSGTLYIADSLNHRIRAVKSDGTVETVAGTGKFGTGGRFGAATSAQLAEPLGVAVTSSGTDLYIVGADQGLLRVSNLAV